jgi:hypothetical protein
MFRLCRERDGKSGSMGGKAVTICPLCHTRALVPTFVLEWRKFGVPDGMKLGTLMSLLFHTFCEDTFLWTHRTMSAADRSSRAMEVADRHYRPLVNGLRVNLSVLNACILSEPYFGGIAGAYSFHRSGCD